MQTREVKTADDARRIIEERGLEYVKVGVFDVDGVMRGKYMAKQNFGIIIGGSFMKKEKFDELTEHDQKVLLETSERAARATDKLSRRDDQRAYDSLVNRGMKVVDTAPHQAAWDAAATQARKNLTGRVYSQSLLDAVEKIVGK